jgi:hypothetical protein
MDSFYIAPYRTFDSRDWVNYPVTAEGRVFRLLARKQRASRRTLENPSCRHQPSPRAKASHSVVRSRDRSLRSSTSGASATVAERNSTRFGA